MSRPGLWHGADWRYLAWGLFTGILAAFGVMTAKLRRRINRWNPLYRMGWFKALWQTIVTDGLFCLTLVFFASAIYNTDPSPSTVRSCRAGMACLAPGHRCLT